MDLMSYRGPTPRSVYDTGCSKVPEHIGSSGDKRNGKLSDFLWCHWFLFLYDEMEGCGVKNTMSGQQEPSQGYGEGNRDPQRVDPNVFQNIARQIAELLNTLRAHVNAQVPVIHVALEVIKTILAAQEEQVTFAVRSEGRNGASQSQKSGGKSLRNSETRYE
ncbi:hypothetical protein Syun_023209 [Stephania yunnanensis]|uniref:Uncharacterized protein n=1 Tax=Stephania yunnanensis TaxID=152371 RepID=A0AAP0FLZ7_9MAGN